MRRGLSRLERLRQRRSQPAPAPRPTGEKRPVLVHVAPWPLSIGGIQRMISQWCKREGAAWDVHIVTPGARSDFEFAHATVHASVADAAARKLVASLAPQVIVHHGPGTAYCRATCAPVVWIVHNQRVFAGPQPRWVTPAAVLSNYPPPPDQCGAGWDAGEITVLPLGVDERAFCPRVRPLTAGIVGRLSPEKVPASFVNALAAWDNPDGAWRIRFIGDGAHNPHQQWTRGRLAGRDWVEFVGDVAPDAMPAIYHELDALLVPSVIESGSYAIVEAMASGVPVIARDVGGVSFTTGDSACLVRRDDRFFAALAELRDGEARAELTARGRAEIETRHRLADHAARQAEIFRRAAQPSTVDVLLPVFNTPAAWLREAWASVRAQTRQPDGVVIVDDGSTDAETIAAINEIAREPDVTLVWLNSNRGTAEALNAGLTACRSRYVARMDADDAMRPERLARQMDYLARHPNVDVLGAQFDYFDRPGGTTHPARVTPAVARESDWFVNHPTVVFRRETVLAAGGYPNYAVAQDLALWLALLERGAVIRNLPDVLLRYRCHPGQATADTRHAATVAAIRERQRSQGN